MNERIQELAKQSGLWFVTPREDLMDDFAELIVRECIQCGDVLAKHYIDTHTEKDQAMLLASIADYSSEIRKHFGVEE